MKKESGAKGKMTLYSYFKESTSSHVEDGESIQINAKDENTIQLVENDWHFNVFKTYGNEHNKYIYEIKVDDLIKLIKEHGRKIE
jgi:hypothetical protein